MECRGEIILPSQYPASVILFVKAPQAGQVKTRLGRVIGYEQAAELYTCFAQDVLTTLCQLPITPLIFFAPDHAHQQVQAWLGDHKYYPQQGRNLGERMSHAFRHSFELGYEQTLIVGSDSPDLPLSHLQGALQHLEADEVVIGPSADGGYYALGFSQVNYCPQVFEGIAWSTESVRSQTLHILQQHNRRVYQLPPWYDVDTLDELRRFYQHNQNQSSHSMMYLRQHDLF